MSVHWDRFPVGGSATPSGWLRNGIPSFKVSWEAFVSDVWALIPSAFAFAFGSVADTVEDDALDAWTRNPLVKFLVNDRDMCAFLRVMLEVVAERFEVSVRDGRGLMSNSYTRYLFRVLRK